MDALHRVAAARNSGAESSAGRGGGGRQVPDALAARTGGHLGARPPGPASRRLMPSTVFEALGGDVVVKPLFGSEGRGLLRISDKELAWRTFHALERLNAVLYLQRVVRHPGHDLRVFVLRGAVLGAMRRHAQPGEWRTNVSLGGRAELAGWIRKRNVWRWRPPARSGPRWPAST